MRLKYIIFGLLFVFGSSTIGACKKATCPTYATSAPTKRKKVKKKKNAPWHKSRKPKQGKKGATPQ